MKLLHLPLTLLILLGSLEAGASSKAPAHQWPTPARSRHLEPVATKKPALIKKKITAKAASTEKPATKIQAKKLPAPVKRRIITRTDPRVARTSSLVRTPAQIPSPTAYSASPQSVYTVPTHVIRLAPTHEPVESIKLDMAGKEIH